MNKNNLLYTIFFLVTFATYLQAQTTGGSITFEKSDHDFGSVTEEGGLVSYKFEFQNTGKNPLKIDSVKASCGCTTPEWTTDAIKPGKKGYILAKYDPMNRPGDFNKTLTIFANTELANTLSIRGKVIPRPKTILDTLLTRMGALRVQYQSFNFGNITTQAPVTQSFDVYNDSTAAITISEISSPSYLKIRIESMTLGPKQRGKINITYNTVEKNELGYVFDNIFLITNDPQMTSKQLYVSANIQEYFPPMTEAELELSPKIFVEEPTFDFGTVKVGQSVTHQFNFKNIGKTNLNIRQTKASCGCTASNPDKNTLNPDEDGNVNVSFSAYAAGPQEKTVTIFSNDPQKPSLILTIKANAEQ